MERKRLNGTESHAMLSLFAATNAMRDAEPLEKRPRMLPRCWQMFKSCVGQIDKMIAMIEISMPREQMYALERNRRTLKYSIAVNGPAKDTRNDGRWLSEEALEALCEGAHEKCIMCTLDPQEQRKCKLAKALDEMPMMNADENSAGCRYHNGLF